MHPGSEVLPREGEVVLFCAHADVGPDHVILVAPHHWYFLGKDNNATTPEGDEVPVRWLTICDACFEQYRDANGRVEPGEVTRQHAEWVGPPPAIDRFI